MVKLMHGQGLLGGVLWSSALSSLVWQGVLSRGLALLGFVRSCPDRQRKVKQGSISVLRGPVWRSPAWWRDAGHGFISVLRGLVLYGTVLSCPVRQRMARFFEVWLGVAGRSPVRLGQVVLGRVWRFMLRSGCAGRATVERGFVWHGKVLSWFGEVLLCAVGFIGALYAKVRFYCGVVWSVEALHSVVKFGPVKYSLVMQAKVSSRHGIVRCRTVVSGFARLRAVGRGMLRRYLGFVWSGEVGRCIARRASAFFGRVLIGLVRRGPAMFSPVGYGIHGYGGYQK